MYSNETNVAPLSRTMTARQLIIRLLDSQDRATRYGRTVTDREAERLAGAVDFVDALLKDLEVGEEAQLEAAEDWAEGRAD